MIIQGSAQRFVVGDLVAETENRRDYLCSPEGGREACYLLEISTDVAHNGALERAAYFFRLLADKAADLEEEYARVKTDPKDRLNYQLGFPHLFDSFLLPEQGDRRVNILQFEGVADVRQLVPLHNLVYRDQRRVDLKTSAWIMGKLLKTLSFAHDLGIAVRNVALGTILIEPKEHYAIIFNWAEAQSNPEGVAPEDIEEDIRRAAACVVQVLGGSGDEAIPDDGSAEYAAYTQYLTELAQRGASSAFEAHRVFYELIRQWWRGYHPFTSLPL